MKDGLAFPDDCVEQFKRSFYMGKTKLFRTLSFEIGLQKRYQRISI